MKKNPRFFKDKQLYPKSGWIQITILLASRNKPQFRSSTSSEQIKTVIDSRNPSSFKDKQLYHGSGSRLQSYLHSGTKLDSEVPPAVSKSKQ
jgi:hypothetical protein